MSKFVVHYFWVFREKIIRAWLQFSTRRLRILGSATHSKKIALSKKCWKSSFVFFCDHWLFNIGTKYL
jgi:hypothetical protein